jgi:methionyl-tRNA synthetase
VLEVTRIVAVGLSPVTPVLSRRVYGALGLADEFDGLDWDAAMVWGRLAKGMKMDKPAPLFPRLVPSEPAAGGKVAVAAGKAKTGGKKRA